MKHTPAVTNCANVSATGSMTRLHLPRHTRLNEKITAHSSVNRSPVPIVQPAQPGPERHEADAGQAQGGRDDVARRRALPHQQP